MNKKLKKEVKDLKKSNNRLFGVALGAIIAAGVNTICLLRTKKQVAQNSADIEALVDVEAENEE